MINKKWLVFAIIFILLIGIYLSMRLNPSIISSAPNEQRSNNIESVSNDENISNVKKQSFTYHNQTFHLYSFYENVLEYINYVKLNPDVDREESYKEYIINPFNENTYIGFTYSLLDSQLSSSTNIDQLEESILDLFKKESEIIELIKEALIASIDYYPLDKDTNIYIFPLDPNEFFTKYNMDGIGGQAYFGNNIFLWIDPSYSADSLKYTVAHEYHHVVNLSSNGYNSITTILDLILTEGKADVFATTVYPNFKPKWIEPLTKEEENAVLTILTDIRQLSSKNDYQTLQQGSFIEKIPQWANYKIGYQIMSNYIEKNPEITIQDWTNLESREIVLGSDYSSLMGYEDGR